MNIFKCIAPAVLAIIPTLTMAAAPMYKASIAGCDKMTDGAAFTPTEFKFYIDGVEVAKSATREFDIDLMPYKGKKVLASVACFGADSAASDVSAPVVLDLRKITLPVLTITISNLVTKTEVIFK